MLRTFTDFLNILGMLLFSFATSIAVLLFIFPCIVTGVGDLSRLLFLEERACDRESFPEFRTKLINFFFSSSATIPGRLLFSTSTTSLGSRLEICNSFLDRLTLGYLTLVLELDAEEVFL